MIGGPGIGGPLSGPCSQLAAKPGVTSSGVSMFANIGNANVLEISARFKPKSFGFDCLP